MTTQRERIEMLEARVAELEKLHPKKRVPQHVSASQVTTRSKEETALPELTTSEEAFLAKYDILPEQKRISLQLYEEYVSDADKRTISDLRRKRACNILWIQPQTKTT